MEDLPVWDHWHAMVSASMGVLGSRDQAHDCAAEAIAQVLERRPSEVANLEAFMVTVAKRRAIDRYRAHTRSRSRDARLAGESALTVTDFAEDITARAEARWVDEQARVLLKPRVYNLLRLLANGTPMAEAAKTLAMTERAAESHLLRARRTVRAALAKTLALIGAIVACGRRTVAPAVTTAAVGLTILVVPWGNDSRPEISLMPDPGNQSSVQVRTASADGVAVSAPAIRQRTISAPSVRAARRTRAAQPTPYSTQVQTPVAGVASYDTDDGQQSSGTLEQVQQCLENLQVTIGYQGCEKKPATSPGQ